MHWPVVLPATATDDNAPFEDESQEIEAEAA